MVLIPPLKLETLIVTNFAGSAEIFLFISVIVISFLTAKLRIPNGASAALYGIFVIIMAGTFLAGTFTALYVVTLVVAVLFIGMAFIQLFP